MVDDSPNIFSDKITLYVILVNKIFVVINLYNNIYRKLRNNDLHVDDLSTDNDWSLCWQNLVEINDFLEFEYIDLLDDKDDNEKDKDKDINSLEKDDKKTKEGTKDKFKKIITKYRTIRNNLNLEDLTFIYENLRYVTTKAGFHNVNSSKTKTKRDLLEPEGDWSKILP